MRLNVYAPHLSCNVAHAQDVAWLWTYTAIGGVPPEPFYKQVYWDRP